jgi:hypothetical protein
LIAAPQRPFRRFPVHGKRKTPKLLSVTYSDVRRKAARWRHSPRGETYSCEPDTAPVL